MADLDWHQNPGSLREVRMCRRSVLWVGEGVVNMSLNSIGTRILEVFVRSECDADQCFG